MNQSLKLTSKQAAPIVAATFPAYSGRKIRVEFAETITFSDTNWGGGSRNTYAALKTNGATAQLSVPAPWINPVEGLTMPMPVDAVVVMWSIFCGHDCGITIYAHPTNAPKWLEAGAK